MQIDDRQIAGTLALSVVQLSQVRGDPLDDALLRNRLPRSDRLRVTIRLAGTTALNPGHKDLLLGRRQRPIPFHVLESFSGHPRFVAQYERRVVAVTREKLIELPQVIDSSCRRGLAVVMAADTFRFQNGDHLTIELVSAHCGEDRHGRRTGKNQ